MNLAFISWCLGIGNLNELFSTIKNIGFTAVQFCGDHKAYHAPDVVATAAK